MFRQMTDSADLEVLVADAQLVHGLEHLGQRALLVPEQVDDDLL